MNAAQLFRLGLFESFPIQPVLYLASGQHIINVSSYGNSLLSTLWVKSVDVGASVTVRWYDIGPGSGIYPGEKIYVAAHATISTSDTSDRRIVPGIHNKAWCEINCIGGGAELGVYVTSVSSFPQEAPFKQGQAANFASDAGNANVIYDAVQDKWFFVSGENGIQNVNITGGTISAEIAGEPFLFKARTNTNPNNFQTLITQTVPANKLWKIRQAKVICRASSEYQIYADGVIIGEGKTGPSIINSKFDWIPYNKLTENKIVELKFRQNHQGIQDVAAYLQVTEEDKP
jgi:hypothetical protein